MRSSMRPIKVCWVAGGVDGAIHRAAGKGLLEECKKLGGCETGGAKITGGYGLKAKHVIHTVGPVWNGGRYGEEGLLASCYRSSLTVAKEHGLRSIAFPSISTGAYRFPLEKAAPIALKTVRHFVDENPAVLQKVIFALFSEGDLEQYKRFYGEFFKDA